MKAVGILLMILAISLPLFAEVKEPKTGIGFPETIDFNGNNLSLAGVGVRTKFVVKVYAAGLYLDSAVVKELASFKAQASDPQEGIYNAISSSAGARVFLLHFARDVDAKNIVEAFEESLKKSLDLKASDVSADVSKFLAASSVSMKEGQQLQVQLNGEEITVVTPSGKSEPIKNSKLASAVAGIWLGKNPISEELKKGLVNRLPLLLQ